MTGTPVVLLPKARVRRATGMIQGERKAMFQSTPAYGGRLRCRADSPQHAKFQSTPAYGGRPGRHSHMHRGARSFQSTPAYGGRHACITDGLKMRVSIHARVRRATTRGLAGSAATSRFQSTPAYGGQRADQSAMDLQWRFNPRPRTAGDARNSAAKLSRDVSIHARVRRATHR